MMKEMPVITERISAKAEACVSQYAANDSERVFCIRAKGRDYIVKLTILNVSER